jgi:ABC-2 type transport system permease protein
MTDAEMLQVLVPLFIVLMTFSAFAGEREDGTLRQLLSLGVAPRRLALGKVAGIAAALGMILLPATVLGVVALALTSETGAVALDASRGVLLVALSLVYFAAIVAVSLGVSARARLSRVALIVLLAFWFANSLVASRLVSDAASSLYPTPSAIEFQRGMDADINDQKEMQQRLERRKAELLRHYQVDNVDALPVAFSGVSLQEGEEHGNEVFDHHYGRSFDTYDRQNAVYQIGGVLAPMLAMRSLSMGLAGTDFNQHRHFITAAESYRRLIQRTMNTDIMTNQKRGTVYLAGRELWDKVPEFEYTAPSTAWVLRHVRWSIVILAAWLLVAIWWMLRPLGRGTF